MNHPFLKKFATKARNDLVEQVGARLRYVLTSDSVELRERETQVKELRSALRKEGEEALVERVAYTWFNRLAALRFMDARGYHPFGCRVVTASPGNTQPEILQRARNGIIPEGLPVDVGYLNDLLDGRVPSSNPQAEAYLLLFVAACNYYSRLMPFVFEQIADYTELLLPVDLLTEHSVVHGFRTEISDDDCAEVEILGWLYQYYISEKKDQVMARKKAVPTEDIPAVTQLFTPHWIVRYLVENSLGRLWLLNRPGSRLREHMPYHIEGEAETDFLKITKPEEIRLCDPAVGSGHMLTYAFDLLTLIYEEEGYEPTEIPALILRHNLHGMEICPRAAQLAELALVFKAWHASRRFFQPEHLVRPHIIELRDVRFAEGELRDYLAAVKLDGFFEENAHEWIKDGTLLARAPYFDSRKPAGILLRLLEARGELSSRVDEFGLNEKSEKAFLKFFKEGKKLDDLAGSEFQRLAAAAFRAFVESREILEYSDDLTLGDLAKQIYRHLLHQFEEAKNSGSLIQPCLDERAIAFARRAIEAKDLGGQLFLRETHLKVLRVLEQAEALTQRYHVVVANPPYMGGKTMNPALRELAREGFRDASSDLFAMFMRRMPQLAIQGGYSAAVAMHSWMFISSFAAFRQKLFTSTSISSLLHFGPRAFDSISGEVVQT